MNEHVEFSGLTFDEIAEEYGLEAAIQAGIDADPDTWELTEEDFAQMRPVSEDFPEFMAAWRASRAAQSGHPPPAKNQLYFGDNLDILRNHVPDASVDLIYLDPPFNSNATYNVLFHEETGQKSAAQITAFEDTWHWSLESERAYRDVVANTPGKLSELLQAMRSFLGASDMMAYLTMMAQRMVELHRVLKDTGSIYLHCDPTASHYLKLLMDAVFGPENWRNEIIWKRTSAHNSATRYGPNHDTILFYTKSRRYTWNQAFQKYDEGYINRFYRHEDEKGRYRLSDLTGAGVRHGDSGEPWRGVNPTDVGRHWAVPRAILMEFTDKDVKGLTSQQKLDLLDEMGLVNWPPNGKMPRHKRYLDESNSQMRVQSTWTDINPIGAQARERLGYPTQKPETLLERIISASSNEGDVVLDPFCGCGTAIAAAERLNRRWIGIDITHLAVTLIRHRLQDTFKGELKPYEIIGQPQGLESAQTLATDSEHDGRYQFEWWALGLVDARPAQGRKKGADSGIDGYINFFDDNSGKAKRIVVQVKSGHVNRGQIATLKGDMEREKAEIGLFITLETPTRPMEAEATSAGFYTPEHYPDAHYPRIQILTIEELLNSSKRAEYPRLAPEATFRRAPRRRRSAGAQSSFA